VLRRLRQLPAGVTVLAALGCGGVLVLVLAAAGTSLPGPPVKEWLGLTEDRRSYPPCRPTPAGIRAPARPPAPTATPGWRRERPVARARYEIAAAAVGRTIFVVGGNVPGPEPGSVAALTTVEAYDTAGGSRPGPATEEALDHHVVVAHDGTLYLLGGYVGGRSTARAWRWAPGERGWEALAPMPTARGAHAAAAIGGRLYVVGGAPENLGDRGEEPFATLDIYDLRTGRWSSGPSMPTARHHVAAAAAAGKLYVAGGRRPGDFSLGAFERFDPETGSWERLADLPQHAASLDVVASGDQVIVVGGGDDLAGWVTPATWSYDIPTGRWRRLPDLRVARHGLRAVVVGDRIYAVAGAPCAGFGQSRVVESLAIPE